MKNILIIEENDEHRAAMVEEINDLLPCRLIQAKDGMQAFHKSRNQAFDVILVDPEVKKISGKKLMESLRESNHNANTPIIVYSENLEHWKKKILERRNIEFLLKPADYQTIVSKLKLLAARDPNKKVFRLDVDFVNPFIDSAMATLNGLCGVKDIHAEKPTLLTEDLDIDIDISGTIAVSSPYFSGSIAISFNEEVYKGIVAQMIEESVAQIDFEKDDGAAEILNVIYGKSKAVLNTKGYSLNRAIPSVTKGKKHKIYQDTKIPVLLVPFNSDAGQFFIQICVKAT